MADTSLAPEGGPSPLQVTAGAAVELRKALKGQDGVAIRIWVEPGMHPKALMALDRTTARDVVSMIDGLPIVLDPPSLRFLEGAQVRYWANRVPPTFEIVGPNLAVPDPPEPTAGGVVGSDGTSGSEPPRTRPEQEARARQAWKSIFDPEIPMNILDLGLIYGTRWAADGTFEIDMTMTSPGCPVAETLVREVEEAARRSAGIDRVRVSVVWDPPWGPDRMTELAKRQLGFL